MRPIPLSRREKAIAMLRCMADAALLDGRKLWRDSNAWARAVTLFDTAAYGLMYEAARFVFAEYVRSVWRSWAWNASHLYAEDMAYVLLNAAALLEDGWTPGEEI